MVEGIALDPAFRARQRAAAAVRRDRFASALAESQRAIGLEPANAGAHELRSLALLGLKRYPEAERAACWGLLMAPQSAELHCLRSQALLQQGRLDEALASADGAVRAQSDSAAAQAVRGLVLERMSRKREALEAYRRSLSIEPRNAEVHFCLGNLLLDQDAVQAEKHYRQSLELWPQRFGVLHNLGVALERQGRALEAAVAFKSALALQPQHRQARQSLRRAMGRLLHRRPRTLVRLICFVVLPLGFMASIAALGAIVDRWPGGDTGLLPIATLCWILLVFAVRKRLNRWEYDGQVRKLSAVDPQLYDVYRKLQTEPGPKRV